VRQSEVGDVEMRRSELFNLWIALDNFNRLRHLVVDGEAYDRLKDVLADDALNYFKKLFEPGNMHLIRELAELIKPPEDQKHLIRELAELIKPPEDQM
jgi:hypothetical protein